MTEEKEVDRRIIHGVLMAVFNRGTLIRGRSGTGKSELALELIARGHRLVSDDAVRLTRYEDELYGESPELTHGVLAVNGLGLVDVAAVFGGEALLGKARIELCVDLVQGIDAGDLLSDVQPLAKILGIPVPVVKLDTSKRPVTPIFIETAVKMLDHPAAGVAQRLVAEHDSSIIHSSPIP